jgi:cobalt-zinc-cadmium efflux system outer membrane protein
MKKSVFILLLLSNLMLPAHSDTLLSLKDCERVFLENNLSLLAAKFNIDEAKAAVTQAGLWDNPSFQANLNAYNPEQKKMFDVGLNGEKAFSLQQLILLGGKRHNEVEMARTNGRIAELEFSDLLRNLKLQLRQSYFEIYYDNMSYQAISSQMNNLDSLIISYNRQVEKGNIPQKDLVRLQSLYLSFKQQKSDLYNNIIDNQNDLELITGLKNIVPEPTSQEFAVYERKALPPLDSLQNTAIVNRSDYLVSAKQVEVSNLNLKFQKLQVVPDLTAGFGWDQQGGAFLNALTFSVGVPLPLWNRNQGNIKMASAQLKAANINKLYLGDKVKNEVDLSFKKWKDAYANHLLLTPSAIQNFKQVEDGVLNNFKHGNLSLIEFTDFMESYNQTLMQYYKFSRTLVDSCEQLNFITNSTIF